MHFHSRCMQTMIFLNHICKYTLRINSGDFFFLHREQKRTTHEFLQLLLKIQLYLSNQQLWVFDSSQSGFRSQLFFAFIPGSRILLPWYQIKANALRLVLSPSVLQPLLFVLQVKNRNASQWQQLKAQPKPEPFWIRRIFYNLAIILALYLTFSFLHSLCI